jgi:glycosyltransferase involved in cell wall biosynthesis
MNIAYYSHYFSPEIGAPSARIFDLSQQWLMAGHNVSVVTCFPNHPVGRLYPGYKAGRYMHETLDGIEVHRTWTYITPNEGFLKRSMGHLSFWPSTMLLAHRHVGATDITIGTSPTLFAAMAALSAARRHKTPFVMEVRDLWPALFIELGVLTNPAIISVLEKWELWMYRQAARVVTVTEAFRQNIIGRGIAEDKVHTIRNGADTTYWQPQPPSPSLQHQLGLEGKFVVLYIGAHGISQALSSIVQSAAQLQDEPAVRFLFVGEGAEKAMLQSRVEKEGVTNVVFHDAVDKNRVVDFYALADVCLVPLRNIPLFDTFIPSKMFEIMAMARPIIGSVRGEAADILSRSGGALVVPPEDSAAIAAAVRRLQTNPGEAQAMGEKGRAFVVSHFSRQRLAAEYLDLLSAILEAWGGDK